MKRLLLSLTLIVGLLPSIAQEYNPVPHPEAVIRVCNARFTVLTLEMTHIQYSDKGDSTEIIHQGQVLIFVTSKGVFPGF